MAELRRFKFTFKTFKFLKMTRPFWFQRGFVFVLARPSLRLLKLNSKSMKFFRMACLNVIMNLRHSLSALIAIGAGFVALVGFQSYIEDVDRIYQDTFRHRMMWGDLIIEKNGLSTLDGRSEPWRFYINETEQQFLNNFVEKHRSAIQSYVRFLSLSGMISSGRATSISGGYGYDVKEGAQVRGPVWEWNTLYGVPLQKFEKPRGLILGQGLGRILGCELKKVEHLYRSDVGGYFPEPRVFNCPTHQMQMSVTTDSGQFNALDFEISGFMDASYKDVDNRFISMDLNEAQTLLNTKGITYGVILLNENSRREEFRNILLQDSIRAGLDFKVDNWKEHRVGDLYHRTKDLLNVFSRFVIIVILTIASLSIFNTMIKNVKERTREIGTLRSLGFKSKQIILMFGVEGFLLSLFGNLLGLVFILVVTFIINSMGIIYRAGMLAEPVPLRLAYSLQLYGLSFLILSLIAVLTCLLASFHSAYKKIVDCLIYA